MRLEDRRRSFPRPSARRGPGGAAAWPGLAESRRRRAQTASKSVSLGLAVVLVVALVYALFKFFGMLRVRHIGLGDLWFVPAAMVAVILVVLLRVVRPLSREILTKSSPK